MRAKATKLQSWAKMLRKMHLVCLILEYFLLKPGSKATEQQSWAKMLRKMHLVCLILEYFLLKPGSLKILPPPPPHPPKKEAMLKCGRNIFALD